MSKDTKHPPPGCWAIITAAGTSQRMGTAIPKQYLPLQDATVLEASISCFLRHPRINAVIVALHANDQTWKDLRIATHKSIHAVIGGATRAQSVNTALSRLTELSQANDFVIVHDAARPCLNYADLDRLINKLLQDEVGGILAVSVDDTIKRARRGNNSIEVESTIDRTHLWRALTPQMFRVWVLRKALNYCLQNNIKVTDEASAVEAIGLQVKLLEGRRDNIKITWPQDMTLAASIIKHNHKC